MRRVAITGIGLLTPLGTGAEANWQALLEGRSAIEPIRGFDASGLHTRVAAEILDFDPKPYIANRRALRMMTRSDLFAVAGSTLAAKDGGSPFSEATADRSGLFIGANKETSKLEPFLEGVLVAKGADGVADVRKVGESARSHFPPLFFIEGLQAASLFYVSEAFGLKGANTYFAGTADSGATAVGRAFRAIREGEADRALAGGFDDATSWWTFAKYDGMGFLSDHNELGARACRPFDRDRTGAVLGEGACILLLEEYEAARARNARIHAEIVGFGSGFDCHATLTPHPDGRGLARAMGAALRDASLQPKDVGYVAAHGSGTDKGDASEARALRSVFGEGASGVAGSSVKAATGHLMAAAGALNVAVAALALEHQTLPPTVGLENVDPECAFDWVKGKPRQARADHALALARGLSGQNVALALRAVRAT
jgi:3-oxoacyl-[acyl-carrier-protein] synthase II